MSSLTPFHLSIAVSGEPCGISSHGLNSYNWTLHRLRSPHPFPGDPGTQILCSRALQPWHIRSFSRLDSSSLGCNHHDSLLSACSLSHHKGYSQLHSCRCRWPLHPRRLIVDPQCAALVQGPNNQYRFLDENWIDACLEEKRSIFES